MLGTGVCKLPGLNCGRTGLGEKAARDAGFDPVSVITVVDDKAHYYPGADSFIVKMIADRNTKNCWDCSAWVPALWIKWWILR